MSRPLIERVRAKVAMLLARWELPAPSPHGVAHASALYGDPLDRPSERLLDLALAAAHAARSEDLSGISARMASGPRWPDFWPGEHYALLAGLVRVLEPRVVVEVGTYQGLGALALAKNLPAGGRVVTFDVVTLDAVQGQTLRAEDLASGRVVPVLADLTRDADFERHRDTLAEADLIFVDAAKDGVMERRFLARFEAVPFRRPPIVVFDDIRLWNMLAIWRDVRRPKLDLTSFGHWSGTGLIDWQPMSTAPAGLSEGGR
jgi:predicted O-methyltransferase YrrM